MIRAIHERTHSRCSGHGCLQIDDPKASGTGFSGRYDTSVGKLALEF
jgi:hypothetical protein